ncbi:hypothetical protein HZC32_03710 [Candidatus Woesearchaeota archaeon]|nr:hypothetical protein [Candidatus Woesearchaeota archaeon]
MPLYEQKWWKRLFGKEHQEKHVDSSKEIEAIGEFMVESNNDRTQILRLLEELEELEKERRVATSGALQINLDVQAVLLSKLLEEYEFFQDDVDINVLRLKMIAKQFLKEAEKAGMHDLVKEKKKDPRWQFWW